MTNQALSQIVDEALARSQADPRPTPSPIGRALLVAYREADHAGRTEPVSDETTDACLAMLAHLAYLVDGDTAIEVARRILRHAQEEY